MGLWDSITGQFVDVISWEADDGQTLVHRFERSGDEIKYGAKLIVREGQAAVFVREGRLADVFTPGTYTLVTRNLPVLSTLSAWKHGFNSPFKAEVWFVSTRQFTGFKWGTKNPVIVRDAEFGAVRVRAFGTFSVQIALPARFLKEIVGTESRFTRDEIADRLRNFVVARFSNLLGENEVPILDLAAHYDELGNYLEHRVREDFLQYGLSLSDVLIENVSLPPAVEEALDRRASLGIIGDTDTYLRFQAAESLTKPGGGGGDAASGVGLGLGFALAREFGREAAPTPPSAPPPLPTSAPLHIAENGRPAGPFPAGQWPALVAAGRLTPTTLVWRSGDPQWTPARDHPEITVLFGDTPPPLPPA